MKNILLASSFYFGLNYRNKHASMNTFDGNRRVYAVSILLPDNNSGVQGLVKLVYDGSKTRIQAKITGLQDGLHGFHIHEFGNLTQGCVTAGPHYNPHSKDHGGPDSTVRHVGDLGNIQSDNQVANYDQSDAMVVLEGNLSVIGRSIVVHQKQDDLGMGGNAESLKTGNAGARLACGVIGLSEFICYSNPKQQFSEWVGVIQLAVEWSHDTSQDNRSTRYNMIERIRDGIYGIFVRQFGVYWQDKNVLYLNHIGNITSTCNQSYLDMFSPEIQLQGPMSIIGRSIVIRNQQHDLASGIIGISGKMELQELPKL